MLRRCGGGSGHRRPPARAGLLGDTVIAMVTVTFRHGLIGSAAQSGYELNLALAALALVVVLLGTGRFSLDVVLRRLFKG